jgi:hypothetical protein
MWHDLSEMGTSELYWDYRHLSTPIVSKSSVDGSADVVDMQTSMSIFEV